MSQEQQQQEDSMTAVETLPDVQTGVDEDSIDRPPPPSYHVIIWNDEAHTYEYVTEMLMVLFGHSHEVAHEITIKVDKEGKGIALTTHKELAELKRDQVLAYGADERMENSHGPVRASIEAAPG